MGIGAVPWQNDRKTTFCKSLIIKGNNVCTAQAPHTRINLCVEGYCVVRTDLLRYSYSTGRTVQR